MWVRKPTELMTAEAAEKGRAARSLGPPLAFAAFGTAAAAVLYSLGVRSPGKGILLLKSSGSDYFRQNPWWLGVVFVGLFLWIYFKQRVTGETGVVAPAPSALLCTSCFDAHPPGTELCACGGQLEPLAHWEWTEEEDAAGEAAG